MGLNDNMYDFYRTAGKKFNKAFTGFNELSVASGVPVIDIKSIYGITDLRDRIVQTGSADVSNDRKEYRLQTGSTTNSIAELGTTEVGRYIAGFEAVPGMGVRVPVLPTGDQEAKWGYFDDTDGFGTGVDSTGMFTFSRRAGTDTKVYSDNWNGGIRRSDLNLKKLNIFRYPFRWYGAGPIEYQVSNVLDTLNPGMDNYHTLVSEEDNPITDNPNLPIKIEIKNGSTASNFEVYVSGRQFFIKGNYNPSKRITSESKESASAGSTNFIPLVSWKQKNTYRSVSCKLAGISMLVSSNNLIWQIRIDSTLTGASFLSPSNIPSSETALEYDTSATALTGGYKIYEDLVAAGSGNSSGVSEQSLPNVNIPYDSIVTLCAKGIGGTANVNSVLRALEEW